MYNYTQAIIFKLQQQGNIQIAITCNTLAYGEYSTSRPEDMRLLFQLKIMQM